jgi:outer membrane lipase/esterase
MYKSITRNASLACLLAFLAMFSTGPYAGDYSRLIVFGDSLSDPGNAFALTGEQSVPPYDTLDDFLVPSAPYAKGGHHLSNGATWIEQLGKTLKVNKSVGPAWRVPGVFFNYAVDRARARDAGLNINLTPQVAAFNDLTNSENLLNDALIVILIGGNDVRDATVTSNPLILNQAIVAISDNIIALYGAGAREFLVGNAPDIGLIPSILLADELFPGLAAGATALSIGFNIALNDLLNTLEDPIVGLPGITIKRLNLFEFITDIVADPASFGLNNADTACVMPGVPPFACKKPDTFFFWDGVHPTKAGHKLFAEKALEALSSQ